MTLRELITELQSIQDKYGECLVEIANDGDNILDTWVVDRVCFFRDGNTQIAIIVED